MALLVVARWCSQDGMCLQVWWECLVKGSWWLYKIGWFQPVTKTARAKGPTQCIWVFLIWKSYIEIKVANGKPPVSGLGNFDLCQKSRKKWLGTIMAGRPRALKKGEVFPMEVLLLCLFCHVWSIQIQGIFFNPPLDDQLSWPEACNVCAGLGLVQTYRNGGG